MLDKAIILWYNEYRKRKEEDKKMKTTTTAADLARKTTTTKTPHGLAFDIVFDEALEALEKEEAEKMI